MLLGAAGLLLTLKPDMPWDKQAPLLMLIPLAYLIASRLYRGRPTETAVVWAAHAGTVVLLLSCLGTAFQGFVMQQGQMLNLLLAAFFAEAALFYLLAAIWRDREFAVYACTAAAAAAVWQVLTFYMLAPEYYIGAFAALGLLLLLAYRFAALEKGATVGLGAPPSSRPTPCCRWPPSPAHCCHCPPWPVNRSISDGLLDWNSC